MPKSNIIRELVYRTEFTMGHTGISKNRGRKMVEGKRYSGVGCGVGIL